MSEENVAVVRSFFDVWNSGDMEAVRELYDPDAIVRAARGWPEPGPFVGRDAVMQQLSEARAAFDNDWAEIVGDLLAAGDRVLARMIWHGTGRGPRSDMEWTIVFTLRDRLIIGAEFVWDHAEALKATGLSD